MADISKKTGLILVIIAIFIVVLFTFSILNTAQIPKVDKITDEGSGSSGEITLILEPPEEPEVKSDTGTASLEIVP